MIYINSLPSLRTCLFLSFIFLLTFPIVNAQFSNLFANQIDCTTTCTIPQASSYNKYYAGLSTLTTSSLTVSGDASSFPTGTLFFIIQMQDASCKYVNDASYGTVLDYGNSGVYEVNELSTSTYNSLFGYTTIFFKKNFKITYVSSPKNSVNGQKSFQVISIPNCGTLTINGLVNNIPAWDGAKGGLFVTVNNNVRFTGTNSGIDVSGRGFRGAVNFSSFSSDPIYDWMTAYDPSVLEQNGYKGEGICGTPSTVVGGPDGLPNGDLSRGAPGNAGGGGDSHNCGGGGGAGAGGNGSEGGLERFIVNLHLGGVGGVAPPAQPDRLFPGGGGGGGQNNNNSPSQGYNGGGIIFIATDGLSGTGSLTTNGITGLIDTNNIDGGGGGGGGGSVYLISHNLNIFQSIQITANGGDGARFDFEHGPGGGGGGGLVYSTDDLTGNSHVDGGLSIPPKANGPGNAGLVLQDEFNHFGVVFQCMISASSSVSLSFTATISRSSTPMPSQSRTETPSNLPSQSPTRTPSPPNSLSSSKSPPPSASPTSRTIQSITSSRSVTPSISKSSTPAVSDSQSRTISLTPTITRTPIASDTPSISITPTHSPSKPPTPVSSSTKTATLTTSISFTPSISRSIPPSSSSSISLSKSISITRTPTISLSTSRTPSSTISITKSPSKSDTQTKSISISPTISITSSISVSPSKTPSSSRVIIPTSTKSITQTPTGSTSSSRSISSTRTPTSSTSITPSTSLSSSISHVIVINPSSSATSTKSPSLSKTESKSFTPSITRSKSLSITKTISKTATETRINQFSISSSFSVTKSTSVSPISRSPSSSKSFQVSSTPLIAISQSPSFSPTSSSTNSISLSASPSIFQCNCDDQNVCTYDTCNPFNGDCLYIPLSSSSSSNVLLCDDQSECTINDICLLGECKGTPIDCSDQNECTIDLCKAKSGNCTHEHITAENSDDKETILKCNIAPPSFEFPSPSPSPSKLIEEYILSPVDFVSTHSSTPLPFLTQKAEISQIDNGNSEAKFPGESENEIVSSSGLGGIASIIGSILFACACCFGVIFGVAANNKTKKKKDHLVDVIEAHEEAMGTPVDSPLFS